MLHILQGIAQNSTKEKGLTPDWRKSLLKKVGLRGVEQPPETPKKMRVSILSGAESGALDARKVESQPDLAMVIEAWPNLPAAIRAGILAIVRAAGVPG